MEDRTHGNSRSKDRDDNRVQDMEEESSDEEPDKDGDNQPPVQPPLPPIPDKVLVKKYDPKQGIYSSCYLKLKRNLNLFIFSSESDSSNCR